MNLEPEKTKKKDEYTMTPPNKAPKIGNDTSSPKELEPEEDFQMENNNQTAEEEEMDFDTLIPESNPITLGRRTFLKPSASEGDKETPDEETPAEATEEVL